MSGATILVVFLIIMCVLGVVIDYAALAIASDEDDKDEHLCG